LVSFSWAPFAAISVSGAPSVIFAVSLCWHVPMGIRGALAKTPWDSRGADLSVWGAVLLTLLKMKDRVKLKS